VLISGDDEWLTKRGIVWASVPPKKEHNNFYEYSYPNNHTWTTENSALSISLEEIRGKKKHKLHHKVSKYRPREDLQ
jgi:hypothetical protein